MVRSALIWLSCGVLACQLSASEIETIAGTGIPEFSGDGGPALKAGCNQTFGLDIGPDGALYWCELANHVVRRLDLKSGLISTYAGTGGVAGYEGDGGPAQEAKLNAPHILRFDAQGNMIIADSSNHVIRGIDTRTGMISTVVGTGEAGFRGDGGPAVKALLDNTISVALDRFENLLICDINNHRIRKVDRSSRFISTWGGNGQQTLATDGAPFTSSPLFGPRDLVVAENGDVIIVLREGHMVYRYDAKTQILHRLAGTGNGGYSGDGGDAELAQVNVPIGVALAPNGDIYFADYNNHAIRVISAELGKITTLVGNGKPGDGPDGDPAQCQLHHPHGIHVAKDGTVFIGDSSNHKVRRLSRK